MGQNKEWYGEYSSFSEEEINKNNINNNNNISLNDFCVIIGSYTRVTINTDTF